MSHSRSTCQGCPLSPILFAVAIEPLSIALKSTSYNQGISRGGFKHILSHYADDLLLFVFPLYTTPRIIELFDRLEPLQDINETTQKVKAF